MALTQITGPYPIFTDLDGTPLDDGYLYIGEPNQDPETNPVQVFWNSALTIPASQPIRTTNGYAWRNGTPGLIYTSGEFSITIRNKRQEFVLYSPLGYGFDPAAVSGAVVKNDYTGDGVQVDFTLSASPSTILATNVFINGVYQEKDSYSLLGNVITFSVAPPISSSIEIITNETGVINSTNASLVSYTAGYAGSVAQTVQSKLEQYISVKDFGAVGDGVTDDSDAFIAARTAAAATGKMVYAPAGRYKLNKAITSSEDLNLMGDGPSTVLDFTGTVTGGSYALEAIGTATQIQNLTGTQNEGLNTVVFASAPSLAVGDVFVIYNPTDYSWSGFRSYYRAGEWCEVESISGSTVTVKNQLYASYAAADVDVYKITGPNVTLRDFSIVGTTILGLIHTEFCINPLIENVTADHANDSAVYFDRCFHATASNLIINNVGDGGDDYGIAVGNSQHVHIQGGYLYSRRHAVTHGGTDGICAVPVRDSRTIGAVLKNDPASGVEDFDFHGNVEDCSAIDCTIYGGAVLGGKNVELVNCHITADSGGRCVYHSEVKGGYFGSTNCKFTTYVDPTAGGRGIYDIGGNSASVTSDTDEDVTFFIRGCRLFARNISSSAAFCLFLNSGATVKTNFEISGLTGDVNDINSILRTSLDSGTADSDFIIVDNISGFPSGTRLHAAPDSVYINFPHRLQKQTGKESISATSGTHYTFGTTVNFKYPYPRAPQAFAGGTNLFSGNVAAIPGLHGLSETQIRPWVYSADATDWNTTSLITVDWIALIDEV